MKQRVLVVDDDRLVADTLRLIFQVNGFESEARYSAADALEFALDFAPELVLCDVTMPRETGLQFAEKLARELPSARMLMLTAFASNTERVEAHERRTGRPLKVLSKPCRPEDLLRECELLLGKPVMGRVRPMRPEHVATGAWRTA